MKNKRLVEIDLEKLKQDVFDKKISTMEVLETLVDALNLGYDLGDENCPFRFHYHVNIGLGSFKQKDGVYYLDREALFKPITIDDLKDVEGFEVCESKEEWEEFKEDQQKKAKQRQVEQKLRERYQARHSKPRV